MVPSEQDGVVMAKAKVMADGVGQLVVVVVQSTLPPTETWQRLVCVMVDLQLGLFVAYARASNWSTYKHISTLEKTSILAVLPSDAQRREQGVTWGLRLLTSNVTDNPSPKNMKSINSLYYPIYVFMH